MCRVGCTDGCPRRRSASAFSAFYRDPILALGCRLTPSFQKHTSPSTLVQSHRDPTPSTQPHRQPPPKARAITIKLHPQSQPPPQPEHQIIEVAITEETNPKAQTPTVSATVSAPAPAPTKIKASSMQARESHLRNAAKKSGARCVQQTFAPFVSPPLIFSLCNILRCNPYLLT